jgi:hypothetical protein
MMMMGKRVAFGVEPKWAEAVIFDVPIQARVFKRRMRARNFMEAFVKHPNGLVAKHYVGIEPDGKLRLLWPVAMNKREAKPL